MSKLIIGTMLLAAADKPSGRGTRTPAPAPSTPATPVDAEDDGGPVDDEVRALITTHTSDAGGRAFLSTMAARGHEIQARIGKLEVGQSVFGVFRRFGTRVFAPRPEDIKVAEKLGEAVKGRAEPSYLIDVQVAGGLSMLVEFVLAADLKRQMGYEKDENRGAYSTNPDLTDGAELSVSKVGMRDIGQGRTVGDYVVTIISPAKVAAMKAAKAAS